MKKMFPDMYDRPESRLVVTIFAYWPIVYVLFPVLLRVMAWDVYNQTIILAWCEIIYNVLILSGILIFCREFLQDSFMNVQINPKNFFSTVAIASGLILVYAVGVLFFGDRLGVVPINGATIFLGARWVVHYIPLWGTLCTTLVCPIASCCLFYATGFAPMCTRNPVLGYILGAFVASLPRLLGYLTMTYYDGVLPTILFQIPVHLIACWSYQKSDTIWAPIATHSIVNLIASLFLCYARYTGLL